MWKLKADLSKGYQNPKRKLGVTAHFSEIFGKKMPYIHCILKLFFKLWLLSYFLKNAWLPTFFILDSNNPYCFSPTDITFAKVPLY